MAIGRTGSFATVQPIKDSIGDAMTATENAGFKYREEERLADEAKAKKQEEANKELEANLANFKGKAVGVNSIDNISQELASSSAEQYAKNARVLTDKNATIQDKDKARLANFQIKRQFENSQNYMQMIIDKKNEIAELVKGDKLNKTDEKDLLTYLKSLENMSARTNENGIWSFSTYKLDENNNPTGVVLNDTDINGVLKGMERFKKPNFEEFKKTFILNNPLDKTKIQSGFTTTTNEKITEEQKERARLAGIALSKNDDEMYQLWLDRTGRKKRNFTDDDRQMAAGAFTEDLISGWKETYEKDIDQSGALAREKSNKEDQEKKVTTAVVETPPQFTGAGIVPRDGYKTISVTGSKPIPSVTGTRVVKYKSGETSNVEETFSNATLNAYTVVSKPDGERAIAALIDYPDIKSSTLKKEAARLQLQVDDNNSSAKEKQTAQLELDRIYKGSENKQAVVYLTESDAIKYGIQMGHEDANKMKDAAGSEPEKEEETPQQRIERLKKAKGLK